MHLDENDRTSQRPQQRAAGKQKQRLESSRVMTAATAATAATQPPQQQWGQVLATPLICWLVWLPVAIQGFIHPFMRSGRRRQRRRRMCGSGWCTQREMWFCSGRVRRVFPNRQQNL